MRKFDLNIESILENWEPYHAVREVIANAIDEKTLTNTDDIKIEKRGDKWMIRDYGRGLNYFHFTQNENDEKMNNSNIIGRFGIGLKDALATFDRHNIKVSIESKYGIFSTIKSKKEGFSDIDTLHVILNDALDDTFVGTEFSLSNIDDEQIRLAKDLFLEFSKDKTIDSNQYGEIITRGLQGSNIYINGVKVAEEPNFLFGYNITNITAPIKKALNRERSNVGRSAYTESVKRILLNSTDDSVMNAIANDLVNINEGVAHDELLWIDIQERAVKTLNATGCYVFMTAMETMGNRDMVDQITESGHKILIIPERLKDKIESNQLDNGDDSILNLSQFIENYNESFQYDFVEESNLTRDELNVYKCKDDIIDMFGGMPDVVLDIRISNTMRVDAYSGASKTLGCWDIIESIIILDRSVLSSLESFTGVLIHELIHAKYSVFDVSREFESELTSCIGVIGANLIKSKSKKSFLGGLFKL